MKPELIYLFAGYTVIWALIFGYTVAIANRQRRLHAELELLRGTVGLAPGAARVAPEAKAGVGD